MNKKVKDYNKSSLLCLDTIKEESEKRIRSTNNLKQYGTKNIDESIDDTLMQKDNYNKTVVDNIINDNETLFLKAIQESQFHIKKTKQKNHKFSSENKESSCLFDSDSQCNCADILVVDDEEFNVMASQKMLQKLEYLYQ